MFNTNEFYILLYTILNTFDNIFFHIVKRFCYYTTKIQYKLVIVVTIGLL